MFSLHHRSRNNGLLLAQKRKSSSSSSTSFPTETSRAKINEWSPRNYVKNWLVGSKGLNSLVDELVSNQDSSASISSSGHKHHRHHQLQTRRRQVDPISDADSVRSIVKRYRKLLVHSSSWELLSPQQILTCLGASSIPLYSLSRTGAKSATLMGSLNRHENSITSNIHSNSSRQQQQGQSDDTSTVLRMIPPGHQGRVVEAQFAESVWSAALPSLNAFSVTITSKEAASVVRSAHRLSVALPPALLRICADKFTSNCIPDPAQRDAQIFEVFVAATTPSPSGNNKNSNDNNRTEVDDRGEQQHQQQLGEKAEDTDEEEIEKRLVKEAVVLMVRTAHAFSAQASLLWQQQSRHEKFSQNKPMIDMIRKAVDERSAPAKSSHVQQDPEVDEWNSSSSSSSSSSSTSSCFPSHLYNPAEIRDTLSCCCESTLSLLETACGVDPQPQFQQGTEQTQKEHEEMCLQRRATLLSLFSYSSLCVSIEATSLIDNYYYCQINSRTIDSNDDEVDEGKNIQAANIAKETRRRRKRQRVLCQILAKELISRVEGASSSTTRTKMSTTVGSERVGGDGGESGGESSSNLTAISLSMIRDGFSLVRTICGTCRYGSASSPESFFVSNNNNRNSNSNGNNDDDDDSSVIGITLANDLYVNLTHKLGTFVRRLAFAGPEFYEEFVRSAIEMEKAANVIQTFQHELQISASSSSAAHCEKPNNNFDALFHCQKQQKAHDPSSIFRGERHSLDGPLVVESVANYFDHVLQLYYEGDANNVTNDHNNDYHVGENTATSTSLTSSNKSSIRSYFWGNHKNSVERQDKKNISSSSSSSFFSRSFVQNFRDIDQYSLMSSVAPLCIGSLAVWSEIEDVRVPAIQILSKSLKYLTPTHLVRLCQLVPRLRSAKYLGDDDDDDDAPIGDAGDDDYFGGRNNEDNRKDEGDAAAAANLLDERKESSKRKGGSRIFHHQHQHQHHDSHAGTLTEQEYAHFIDELLAAIYVSYKDLPCEGCCLALRSLAELSVIERERLVVLFSPTNSSSDTYNNKTNNDSINNTETKGSASTRRRSKKTASSPPHVLPIGALSLCVQALTARISELLENDAKKIASSSKSSSETSTTTTTTSAKTYTTSSFFSDTISLASDQRIDDSDSVVVRCGYQTALVLEHIGVSLAMLGMLPGVDANRPCSRATECGN